MSKNFFTSNAICDEYMACIDMNENIVTRNFLTQNFANEINANYDISLSLSLSLRFSSLQPRRQCSCNSLCVQAFRDGESRPTPTPKQVGMAHRHKANMS